MGRAVRTVLLASLIPLTLGACASLLPRPADQPPRVAALRPVMEQVAAAYPHWCIWGGSCTKSIPSIVVVDGEMAAGYNYYFNRIRISRWVLDAPQWVFQAMMAHEMGHWVRQDWLGGACAKDVLVCEIGANREAVRLLEIGWGIPGPDAIEQMHRVLRYGKGGHGHDPAAELVAFRATFACADTTLATCTVQPSPVLGSPSSRPSPMPNVRGDPPCPAEDWDSAVGRCLKVGR